MEYAAVVARFGVVDRESLPMTILGSDVAAGVKSDAGASPESAGVSPGTPVFRPLAQELLDLERQRMKEALLATGGVKNRAATLLSMAERTFRLKLRLHGLDTFGSGGGDK
jgi:DNA-binding NtrC family response regulator